MIKITCNCKTTRPIDSLKEFQEDIKLISDKKLDDLILIIETHGFNVPMIIWKDWIMDGHQRKKALKKKGYVGEVPVIEIEAENKKDAKEKLLAITSQHGVFDIEALENFTKGLSDLDSVSLVDGPHLNLDFKVDLPEDKKPSTTKLEDDIQIIDSDEYQQAEVEEIKTKIGEEIKFPDGSILTVGTDVLFAEEVVRHWNSRNRTKKVEWKSSK